MTNNAEMAVKLLAKALEVKVDALGPDASIDTIASWDSIAHMRLILSIESHLGRQLGPMEIAEVFTLKDVDKLVGTAL